MPSTFPEVAGERRGEVGRLDQTVMIGLAAMLGYLLLLPHPYLAGAYGDDASYVMLARALAHGIGYRSTWLPGSPVHVQYPPGLPAVLSVAWALGGGPRTVMWTARLLDVLLVGTTAGLLWRVARRRVGVGPHYAALFAIGPFFLDSALQYFGLALAEPWFMALWAVALLMAYRSDEDDGAGALAGVALGLAALFRTQALVLLPALAVGVGLRTKRVRPASLALGAGLAPVLAVAVVRWAMLRATGPASGQTSYLSDLLAHAGGSLAGLPSNVWFNVRGYTLLFSLYTSFWLPLGVLLVAAFAALAVSGGVRLWRAHPELVCTCAANAAVILLWPYNIDRFVVSALPFVGVLAAAGAERLAGGARGHGRLVVQAVALVLAAQVAARQVQLRRQGLSDVATGARPAFWTPSWEVPYFGRFIELSSAWLRASTAPDARVLTPWPVAIALNADRRSFDPEGPLPGEVGKVDAAAAIASLVVRDSIDVVVVAHGDQRVARGVRELRARCPSALSPAGSVGPYGLPAFYRVTRSVDCLRLAADGS